MFRQIDIDGNGTIDYTEFVMATMNQMTILTTEKLEQAFKMFDKVSEIQWEFGASYLLTILIGWKWHHIS